MVSSIGRGLCVLIGISRDDTVKDMEFMYVWTFLIFMFVYISFIHYCECMVW